MKKLYLICVALLIIAFSCFVNVDKIGTDYQTSGNYTYKLLDDGTISIVKYDSSNEEDIVVPEKIENYTVSYIEKNAYDCLNVKSIYIANTISKIANKAFYNCQNVTKIYIGANFNSTKGFENLIELNSLHINYGIDGFMVDYAKPEERFYHEFASQISELIINQGVRYLSDYAFYGFSNLESLIIDDSIESIGDYCFYECKLDDLYLPLSLTSIGEYGLYSTYSSDNKKIVIPQKVSYIGENAISNNHSYYVYKESTAYQYMLNNGVDYNEIDLSFSDETLVLNIGETYQTSINNPSLFKDEITYTSSDQRILTIDQNGLITTSANGNAYIYCQSESGIAQLNVEVVSDDDSIETIYERINIKDEFKLSLDLFKSLPGALSDYTLQCEDESIIKVGLDGTIKANKRGITSVLITDGSRKARVIFEVGLKIKTISLGSEVINLYRGNSYTLNVSLNPSVVDNSFLSFKSDNPEVASVNSKGVVTGLSNGTCNITVSSNDGSYTNATIQINVSTSWISIETSKIALVKDKYFRVRCNSGDGSKLIYSTSDENIAIVDEEGKITGISEGDVLLNISNTNRSAFISIPVRVYEAFSYGIDLSEWNGRYWGIVNFQSAVNEGIDFVYLRLAYGANKLDPIFQQNYDSAKAVGLDVGAYHYITATTVSEAIQQANFMLQCLDGKQFEYPIMVDIEESYHNEMSASQLSQIANAYCDVLENAGYLTNIYSFSSILNRINTTRDKWVAQWGVLAPDRLNSSYTMWQTSSVGLVIGFSSYVDTDICFFDYPTYIKENHYNGY